MSKISITGGSARGRVITHSGNDFVRPTTSMTRQGIFSILDSREIRGAFLDLFSGSGIMACEAISRGFDSAVCVEASRQQCFMIKSNLELLNMVKQVIVLPMKVEKALNRLKSLDIRFSVVYMDPPYKTGIPGDFIFQIFESGILSRDGVLMLEKSIKTEPPHVPDGSVVLSKCHKWGETEVCIYEAG
ncbi:MAG: RsmD family RNA methyltransferase [Deltaproteobacteria bacterium]|nr:RsmD family RNA methyltransferase [Deltaproteobacteria bacterium]